jgi:hypothetical protein
MKLKIVNITLIIISTPLQSVNSQKWIAPLIQIAGLNSAGSFKMKYFNLINGIKSRPFVNLATAQSAAHDLTQSAWENGLNFTTQTIDADGRVITEFKMIEIIQ